MAVATDGGASGRSPITRRRLLTVAMAVLGAATAEAGPLAGMAGAATSPGRLLVPGYRSLEALGRGGLLVDQPGVARLPAGWDGPRTLLSVLDLAAPDAPPRRAAYPLRGHGTALVPAAGIGIFAGMEGRTMVAFDAASLDLVAMAETLRPGWHFGGHAVALPDGRHIAVTERAPAVPAGPDRAGDLARMAGRVVIREAASLRPVADFSSHGLRPHDIRLTADGRHLVVANYGSTVVADGDFALTTIPHILAPCAAIIELASGKLVARFAPADLRAELRHLAAPALDRVFAVLARLEAAASGGSAGGDPVAGPGLTYAPAAPVRRDGAEAVPLMKGTEDRARQALSIAHDPATDRVWITFPSSHLVAVFDGAGGRTLRLIETDRLGLHWPCGIAPSADGRHWLVTGYWGGMLSLDGTTLQPGPVNAAPLWWGHSHTVTG
ncbi:DUF1513 domain-containing protein [Zavarzinia compransoris]|uniref:DUF1513 domain-containing protein n=1 Tax=Zavarzinia marina TaxID=2911065 RepID=UPI001F341B36|nr:DUF1513 domain-containing protein [Zavarzinia marina]MCF4165993.1 DUF1513 domain-containing protein [Zavarzinia marina]